MESFFSLCCCHWEWGFLLFLLGKKCHWRNAFLDLLIKEDASSHLQRMGALYSYSGVGREQKPSCNWCLSIGDTSLHVPTRQPQPTLQGVCGGERAPGQSFGVLNRVSQSIGTNTHSLYQFPAGESPDSTLTFTLYLWAGRHSEAGYVLSLSSSSRNTELALEADLQGYCMWTWHGVRFCLRPALTSTGSKNLTELNDMWGAEQSAILPPIYRDRHWGSNLGSKMSTVRIWDIAAAENHTDFSLSPVLCLYYRSHVWVCVTLFVLSEHSCIFIAITFAQMQRHEVS